MRQQHLVSTSQPPAVTFNITKSPFFPPRPYSSCGLLELVIYQATTHSLMNHCILSTGVSSNVPPNRQDTCLFFYVTVTHSTFGCVCPHCRPVHIKWPYQDHIALHSITQFIPWSCKPFCNDKATITLFLKRNVFLLKANISKSKAYSLSVFPCHFFWVVLGSCVDYGLFDVYVLHLFSLQVTYG